MRWRLVEICPYFILIYSIFFHNVWSVFWIHHVLYLFMYLYSYSFWSRSWQTWMEWLMNECISDDQWSIKDCWTGERLDLFRDVIHNTPNHIKITWNNLTLSLGLSELMATYRIKVLHWTAYSNLVISIVILELVLISIAKSNYEL